MDREVVAAELCTARGIYQRQKRVTTAAATALRESRALEKEAGAYVGRLKAQLMRMGVPRP